MSECIFCRIVRGEIPCKKVYEDEDMLAFHDINPWAPVHVLIIPKQHIISLATADVSNAAVLGKILARTGDIARSQGLNDGFRTVINSGRIGNQEVYHLHLHILGGPEPLGGSLKPMTKK
jgi:histidine triad (HIT) family protein